MENLSCPSGLFNSYNLLIFIFRNSKFDLEHNFANNLKTRMLEDLGGQILYRSLDPRKIKNPIKNIFDSLKLVYRIFYFSIYSIFLQNFNFTTI